MSQFSPTTDKALNEQSRRITNAEIAIAEATADKDEAFQMAFETFDEFGLVEQEARFIADDGFVIARQVRQGSPKLDEQKFLKLLVENYGETKATRIWNQITDKKVNSSMLERFVQQKKIDAALVDRCIEQGTVSFPRIHREWTKEDHQRAAVIGIEVAEHVPAGS